MWKWMVSVGKFVRPFQAFLNPCPKSGSGPAAILGPAQPVAPLGRRECQHGDFVTIFDRFYPLPIISVPCDHVYVDVGSRTSVSSDKMAQIIVVLTADVGTGKCVWSS